MPCGSDADSTNPLNSRPPSVPVSGWSWKFLLPRLARSALGWVRRTRSRQLLELDDHLLADIGVSRTGTEDVRRSQLYLEAWRDSK